MLASLLFSSAAQSVKTHFHQTGLTLKDASNDDRIILDGDNQKLLILINDSVHLEVQGGEESFVKLINLTSQKEIGIAMEKDGDFKIGAFEEGFPPDENPLLNLRNGLYRPNENTIALVTDFTERLRISEDGSVGIGTYPDPSVRLNVGGKLRIEEADEDEYIDTFIVLGEDGVLYTRPLSSFIPLPESAPSAFREGLEDQDLRMNALLERIERLEKTIEGLR